MAQMNRNVNLEEIDSDALFGIDALKNQTIFQKIIFFGCVLIGVVANVAMPLIWETPRLVCIFVFMFFLLIGVAFGCNYTEDMTYGKYLYYFFFKPSKDLVFKSTEDIKHVKIRAREIRKEEEMTLNRKKQAEPEAQRKLLIKLVAFVVILAVVLIGAFSIKSGDKEKVEIHHTVNRDK